VDHVGHDLVVAQALVGEQVGDLALLGLHVGDDLGRRAAGHGGETVDLQHAEEEVVQLIARHGTARNHADAPTYSRVDDEIGAGLFRNDVDQRLDFGITQIQRQRVGLRHRHQPGQRGKDKRRQQSAKHRGSQSINWMLRGNAWPSRSTTRSTRSWPARS
jgi:hypothetical protein